MVYQKFYCILVSDSTMDGQTKLWIVEIMVAVFDLATLNCNSLIFLTYPVISLVYEKVNLAGQRYSSFRFSNATPCDIHNIDGRQIHGDQFLTDRM